jgi:hypothetical protein
MGSRIAEAMGDMKAPLHFDPASHTERLWTAADGTVCILITSHEPPYYAIALVRDEQIVRERRLYGLASAHMIADGWRERGEEVLTRSNKQ